MLTRCIAIAAVSFPQMSYFATLWLMLLHAFASTPAQSVLTGQRDVAGAGGVVWHAGSIIATPRQSRTEFVRASLGVPFTVVAPPSRRAPLAGVPPLHKSANPARLLLIVAVGNVLGMAEEDSHWLQADELRFPYFPTAPPSRA